MFKLYNPLCTINATYFADTFQLRPDTIAMGSWSTPLKYFTLFIVCQSWQVATMVDDDGGDAEQVHLESLPELAVFTRTGTVVPEMSFGHLIIPTSLKTLLEWRTALLLMKTHWKDLIRAGNFSKSQESRFRAMDSYTMSTMALTDEKITGLLKSLGLNPEEILDDHARHLGNPIIRHRRQIISAMVGLGIGVIGSELYQNFKHDTVVSILQKKQNVLVEEVEQDMIKIASNRNDIARLNATTRLILDQTARMVMGWRRAEIDILLLSGALQLAQSANRISDLVDSLDSARHGRFDLRIATPACLSKAIDQLKQKAAHDGAVLAITNVLDLTALDTTLVYDRKSGNLLEMVHVPIKSSELTLYRLIAPPLKIHDDLFARIEERDTLLAVNLDRTAYQTYSVMELSECKKINLRYFCPKTILYKPETTNCILSLYNNRMDLVKQNCNWKLRGMVTEAFRINETSFLITSTHEKELSVACMRYEKRMRLKGNMILTMPTGCTATTDGLIIRRQKFEGDVEVVSGFGSIPLLRHLVLPESNDMHWVATANKLLAATGTLLDAKQVTGIAEFENRLQAIEESGDFDLIKFLLHSLLPNLAVLIMVMLIAMAIWKMVNTFTKKRRENSSAHHADLELQPRHAPPPYSGMIPMGHPGQYPAAWARAERMALREREQEAVVRDPAPRSRRGPSSSQSRSRQNSDRQSTST